MDFEMPDPVKFDSTTVLPDGSLNHALKFPVEFAVIVYVRSSPDVTFISIDFSEPPAITVSFVAEDDV